MKNKKFMFFENFLEAIGQLPEEERAVACYEFCKYGISGELPKNKYLAMFCLGVSASVQKYQGSGGKREGAGAPIGNKNAKKQIDNAINQINQNNQNNQIKQINQIQQTETETETKNRKKEIKKENLTKYGEFKNVCLEEDYYEKLKSTFGEEKLNKAIEKLDAWLDNPKQSKQRNHNHRGYFKSDSWVWEQKPTLSVGGKPVVEHNLDWI